MDKTDLTRTLIDVTISRMLREMEDDTGRSVRKLLDTALTVSKGRFQTRFFESVYRMMEHENSAYYQMIENLIAHADQNKLKSFGMNLGYNGCTVGAKRIRENEAAWGFDIPWNIILSIGNGTTTPFEVNGLIRQGKELGVYVYTIFSHHALDEAYHEVFKQHSDCAFILLTDPDEVLETVLDGYADLLNCMIVVDSDRTNIQAAADELTSSHFLFGTCRKYTKDTLDEVLSDDALAQCEKYGGAFVLMCPTMSCSMEETRRIEKRVAHIRNQQRYPFLLMDVQADNLRIDRVISDSPCSVAFDGNGQIHAASGEWTGSEYNYLHTDLKKILQKTNAKMQAKA